MIRFLASRLALLLVTVFGALVLVFFIVRFTPGDPVELMLGDYSGTLSQAELQALRAEIGTDKPLLVQLGKYIAGVVRGDLGTSFRTHTPVLDRILRVMPSTLLLTFAGMAVALVIGLPLGIVAARWSGKWPDYSASVLAIVWTAAPGFWFAMLLIYLFGFKLRWFPIYGTGMGEGLSETLRYLALPAFVIGARHAGEITRMTRSCMLEILGLDYVRTARAKGLTEPLVFYKHALRNAGIPLITVFGMSLAYLIGSAVIVEVVFARPGLGKLMADAMSARDYPTVQGVAVVFAAFVSLVNFLTDMSYGLIDPRVRRT